MFIQFILDTKVNKGTVKKEWEVTLIIYFDVNEKGN